MQHKPGTDVAHHLGRLDLCLPGSPSFGRCCGIMELLSPDMANLVGCPTCSVRKQPRDIESFELSHKPVYGILFFSAQDFLFVAKRIYINLTAYRTILPPLVSGRVDTFSFR